MATLQAFDTLGYVKTLTRKGYEREKAEALAEAQQEFFAKDVASENFVRDELEKATNKLENKIEQEGARLENKIEQEIAKLDNKIAKLDNKIEREIEKLRHEITASEKRMTMATGKMLAFAVGVILAGLPIIQAILAKMG